MDYNKFWLTQCPRCNNIQISHGDVERVLCASCSKPFRVKLKEHANRVVARADSLEEARAIRTRMLEARSNTVKKEEDFFYLCEVCKNKFGPFTNATIAPNMKVCANCGQLTMVYKIGSHILKPQEPINQENKLTDEEKAGV